MMIDETGLKVEIVDARDHVVMDTSMITKTTRSRIRTPLPCKSVGKPKFQGRYFVL